MQTHARMEGQKLTVINFSILTPVIHMKNETCGYLGWVLLADTTDERNSYLFDAIGTINRTATNTNPHTLIYAII